VTHLSRPSDKIIAHLSQITQTNIKGSPSIPISPRHRRKECLNDQQLRSCASTRPEITKFPISGGRKKKNHAVMTSFNLIRKRSDDIVTSPLTFLYTIWPLRATKKLSLVQKFPVYPLKSKPYSVYSRLYGV